MRGIKTGPATSGLSGLMVPGVSLLIAFLGYGSQWLFNTSPDLAPGALTKRQSRIFNLLLVCLWWTYYRAVTIDPGRYTFPPGSCSSDPSSVTPPSSGTTQRWCKKCRAPKPPRAHHCRHCGRCIPKMDHHCPWTANCVSMTTFPYFLRFLLYTNVSLWALGYFLVQRLAAIWADRHLPAYLGPSLGHLIVLTLMSLACLGTTAALGILLFTTLRGWLFNTTMIEDWEVERHEALLTRHGDDDDFWGLDGGGGRLRVEAIEFPYDLGFFANMAQAMGTRNVLRWFLPVGGGGPVISPTVGKGVGWEWEENGFNDRRGMWPPPDPERIRGGKAGGGWPGAAERVRADDGGRYFESPEERKASFARRQEADLRRRRVQKAEIMAELEEPGGDDYEDDEDDGEGEWEGAPLWTNSEGDTLWDYGVDEDMEMEVPQNVGAGGDEDEDVPLAELIRRRKQV